MNAYAPRNVCFFGGLSSRVGRMSGKIINDFPRHRAGGCGIWDLISRKLDLWEEYYENIGFTGIQAWQLVACIN